MIDFEKLARRLIRDRNANVGTRLQLLDKLAPDILRQIGEDRGPRGPLIFWAKSQNTDEIAKKNIVDPVILKALLKAAGEELDTVTPHAGIQHTYGYLFSTIDTPYGKKRDRWVTSALEDGLGLPGDLLGPQPSEGTLLANVTWIAGSLAFSGNRRAAWMRRCLAKRVASAIKTLTFPNLTAFRLTESFQLLGTSRKSVQIQLVTDLVPFPRTSNHSGENHLLVYCIKDSREKHPQIVTLFTVTDAYANALIDRASFKTRTDIRPRYNAVVPGFKVNCTNGTVSLTRHRVFVS